MPRSALTGVRDLCANRGRAASACPRNRVEGLASKLFSEAARASTPQALADLARLLLPAGLPVAGQLEIWFKHA